MNNLHLRRTNHRPRDHTPLDFLFPPGKSLLEIFASILDVLAVLASFVAAYLFTSKSTHDSKIYLAGFVVLAQFISSLCKNYSLHRSRHRESLSLQKFVEAQRELTKSAADLLTYKSVNDGNFEVALLDNLVRCLDPDRKCDLRATLYERVSPEPPSDQAVSSKGAVDTFHMLAHSKLYGDRAWPRRVFTTSSEPGKTFIPILVQRGVYSKSAQDLSVLADPRYPEGDADKKRDYFSFFNVAMLDVEGVVSHMLTCDSLDEKFFTDDEKNIIRAFADMAQECFQARFEIAKPESPLLKEDDYLEEK